MMMMLTLKPPQREKGGKGDPGEEDAIDRYREWSKRNLKAIKGVHSVVHSTPDPTP
jgi:hypothetical protein